MAEVVKVGKASKQLGRPTNGRGIFFPRNHLAGSEPKVSGQIGAIGHTRDPDCDPFLQCSALGGMLREVNPPPTRENRAKSKVDKRSIHDEHRKPYKEASRLSEGSDLSEKSDKNSMLVASDSKESRSKVSYRLVKADRSTPHHILSNPTALVEGLDPRRVRTKNYLPKPLGFDDTTQEGKCIIGPKISAIETKDRRKDDNQESTCKNLNPVHREECTTRESGQKHGISKSFAQFFLKKSSNNLLEEKPVASYQAKPLEKREVCRSLSIGTDSHSCHGPTGNNKKKQALLTLVKQQVVGKQSLVGVVSTQAKSRKGKQDSISHRNTPTVLITNAKKSRQRPGGSGLADQTAKDLSQEDKTKLKLGKPPAGKWLSDTSKVKIDKPGPKTTLGGRGLLGSSSICLGSQSEELQGVNLSALFTSPSLAAVGGSASSKPNQVPQMSVGHSTTSGKGKIQGISIKKVAEEVSPPPHRGQTAIKPQPNGKKVSNLLTNAKEQT